MCRHAASGCMRFPLAALLFAALVAPTTAGAFGPTCQDKLSEGDVVGFARCNARFTIPPPPPVGSPPSAYVEWAFYVLKGVCVSNEIPPYIEVDPECGPKSDEESDQYLLVLHPLP